ncbi:hypothetical protein HDU67_004115 [Dinochytrium kinnereticum]|nr:hypothetical protein HDU67_004115 [Dinochytrium kinnereticum]
MQGSSYSPTSITDQLGEDQGFQISFAQGRGCGCDWCYAEHLGCASVLTPPPKIFVTPTGSGMDEKRKLVIMRGAPGSGKSTLASLILQQENYDGVILSTDDFWFVPNEAGEMVYVFNVNYLSDAHAWNLQRAYQVMESGSARVVIIDNTNMQAWEPRPYVQAGVKFGYELHVREPDTTWWKERDVDQMARRNKHHVSREVIEAMVARWEEDFSLENILASERPSNAHR